MKHHLQFDCKIHEIPCKYHALLGCKAIITPLTQEIHEKGSLDLHLSMAVEQLSQMREQLSDGTQDRAQMKGALRKVGSFPFFALFFARPLFDVFATTKKRCVGCAPATQFDETVAESRASKEIIHDLRLSQNEIKKENERLSVECKEREEAFARVLQHVKLLQFSNRLSQIFFFFSFFFFFFIFFFFF